MATAAKRTKKATTGDLTLREREFLQKCYDYIEKPTCIKSAHLYIRNTDKDIPKRLIDSISSEKGSSEKDEVDKLLEKNLPAEAVAEAVKQILAAKTLLNFSEQAMKKMYNKGNPRKTVETFVSELGELHNPKHHSSTMHMIIELLNHLMRIEAIEISRPGLRQQFVGCLFPEEEENVHKQKVFEDLLETYKKDRIWILNEWIPETRVESQVAVTESRIKVHKSCMDHVRASKQEGALVGPGKANLFLEQMEKAAQSKGELSFENVPISAVATAVTHFIRNTSTLIPIDHRKLYHYIHGNHGKPGVDIFVQEVQNLPLSSRKLIKAMFRDLIQMEAKEGSEKMTFEKLVILFGPHLTDLDILPDDREKKESRMVLTQLLERFKQDPNIISDV